MTSGYIETDGELVNKTGNIVEVTGQDEPGVVYEITVSDFMEEKNESKQLHCGWRTPLHSE